MHLRRMNFLMNRVDIDNIYTNLFLISLSRQCDFVKLVNEADEEISQLENDELPNIKGYEGLYFIELLARKMGSSIGEAYSLASFQQNEIVKDILNSLNSISDAYSIYYDDSCEESIEFQGSFSMISTKDKDELFKYYHSIFEGDSLNNIYSHYKITFQKFLEKVEGVECTYYISVSTRDEIKSEYMYDSFEIWAGDEGFPADFIESVIDEYTQKSEEVEDDLEEVSEQKSIEESKTKINVELPTKETQYLPDGRECKEELADFVFDTTRTVDLLDKFEGIGKKNNVVYKRLVIANGKYQRWSDHGLISFNLVIERGRGTDYVGDTTFTAFKKGEASGLRKHVDEEVTEEVIKLYKDKNQFFRFSKPYLLRAQNSSNRTGYGWEWDWSGGYGDYTEGTLYGETTNYFFVGVYITAMSTFYDAKERLEFSPASSDENSIIIDGKYTVQFYTGKLNKITSNDVVQRFLKISKEKKDKFRPISWDEIDKVAYISEEVCKKYKDLILSGEFEYKRNFIE